MPMKLGKMSGASAPGGTKSEHQLSAGKSGKGPLPGGQQFLDNHKLQHADYASVCGKVKPGKNG